MVKFGVETSKNLTLHFSQDLHSDETMDEFVAELKKQDFMGVSGRYFSLFFSVSLDIIVVIHSFCFCHCVWQVFFLFGCLSFHFAWLFSFCLFS